MDMDAYEAFYCSIEDEFSERLSKKDGISVTTDHFAHRNLKCERKPTGELPAH